MPPARRAEAFDALIEHASTTPSHALRGTPYAELAAVLAGLSSLAAEPVRPRAEFSADLRTRLMAAAGIRLASSGPTFLERYLDEPLEAAVTRLSGSSVSRAQLVEVGNLAALSAGSARIMIIAVTWLLAAQTSWSVPTPTLSPT